ncbi:MAG: MBL fold metallo-hydrolase [Gammaproteobacteria bacterium]|nr:MBL fold metallo-hydrolase [Gammaproteobacteria bacterium]
MGSFPPYLTVAGIILCTLLGTVQAAEPRTDPTPYCGNEGVWIQILGAGGPELDDGQGGPGYVVFADNKALLLVDTAPGSSVAFDKAGAKFEDLEAIVLTHLHADHAGDFPAFVKGSYFAGREALLPVLGPDGAGPYPDTETFVERLIGADGAFAYLADFLTFRSSGGYKLSVRNVPAAGRRVWSAFRADTIRLAAVPVNHGPVPALAWRVEIGDQSIVFTGDFNNQKDLMADFAAGADALVIHHAIPEGTRGEATNLHVTPSQIGDIAERADVRMVILGHRMNRTRGLESISREAIEERYNGSLIFANDLECWGL